MVGRHVARVGGLRRVGDVIVDHPLSTGAVVTAALVAALAVTPFGTTDLLPTPAHSHSSAAGAAPVVALSVPNVVGASESGARDALAARGFSTEFRTASGEPATGRTDYVVIRQSPGAGARAAKGATIDLTVAPAGSSVSTPPQNAAGSTAPGTVSAPAESGSTPATGVTGGGGPAGNTGGAVGALVVRRLPNPCRRRSRRQSRHRPSRRQRPRSHLRRLSRCRRRPCLPCRFRSLLSASSAASFAESSSRDVTATVVLNVGGDARAREHLNAAEPRGECRQDTVRETNSRNMRAERAERPQAQRPLTRRRRR